MARPINFLISADYTGDLKKRLAEYGISHGELSREMGVQESQISRWFNKPVQPRLVNILKIEAAVASIRKRKEKERRRSK
jgi:predicted transcriptional regulator